MKSRLLLGALLAISTASATIIYDTPAINGTYGIDTGSGSTVFDLSGVGVFTNPNDTSVETVTRYYTGTISTDATTGGGSGFQFSLQTTSGTKAFSLGKYEWNSDWKYWANNASGGGTSLGQQTAADLDFQIKVVNGEWNASTAYLFIGNAATASTEGTAGFILSSPASDISKLSINPTHTGGNVTISNFATGDEWIAVPEPATMGMIGLFGGGILFIRRIFLV